MKIPGFHGSFAEKTAGHLRATFERLGCRRAVRGKSRSKRCAAIKKPRLPDFPTLDRALGGWALVDAPSGVANPVALPACPRPQVRVTLLDDYFRLPLGP